MNNRSYTFIATAQRDDGPQATSAPSYPTTPTRTTQPRPPGGGGGGSGGEPPEEETAGLVDVDANSVHAGAIEALFVASITVGCSTQPLSFCPDQPVTRAPIATFLTRALNLL